MLPHAFVPLSGTARIELLHRAVDGAVRGVLGNTTIESLNEGR
jgi:hypothetical protein